MSHFAINLGQTAEDSDMFTNIWLSSIGLTTYYVMHASHYLVIHNSNDAQLLCLALILTEIYPFL